MMRCFLALLLFFSFLSCEAQSGGIGFWNMQPAPGPDPDPDLRYLYQGDFIAFKEGSAEVLYVAARSQNAVIKYQYYPTSAPAELVATGFLTPTHIREAGGHLFVMDRDGTRITRINKSNYADRVVVFDNPTLENKLISFAPLLQDGQSISQVQLHGLILNYDPSLGQQNYRGCIIPGPYNYLEIDGDISGCPTNQISTRDKFILTILQSNNSTAISGAGDPGGIAGPGDIGSVGGNIGIVRYSGVNRIASAVNVYGTGKEGFAWIFDADKIEVSHSASRISQVVSIYSYLHPFVSLTYWIRGSAFFNIGTKIGVTETTLLDQYGRFLVVRYLGGTYTQWMAFNSENWSPVVGESDVVSYHITTTNQPGQRSMIRLREDGTWTNIGLVIKY